MTLRPGVRLGAYEIVAPIGAGGMGEVYRARDVKLGRDVALKLLPTGVAQDRDRAMRFIREAQILAALNHPHIGAIYGLEEAGPVDDHGLVQFLLLEFVDGETLASTIDRVRAKGTGLPLDQALTIARQIAEAVGTAHDTGVIHRDLKPDNVMIRRDGIVKVLDFGLAKLTEPGIPDNLTDACTSARGATAPGTVMGTARYMSPEQARGEEVDARSDIFSLGIIVYEMVAGRSPFSGTSGLDAVSGILKCEPPPLRAAAPHAPAELQRIVNKALRKDRDERYQSMKELSLDLKSQQQEIEFEAKITQTSGAVAAWPPARRRLGWIAAAIGAMVLAVAGLVAWYNGNGPIESVAVLPLVNATNDPAMEYLSDGITESLINSLSQIPRLKVMSRNSVFRLKGRDNDAHEIGRTLGVRGVLTGRLARRGDNLAVSLELSDAEDNSQIWGQQYAGRLAEVFALQESMARDLTDKMRVKLTGAEEQRFAKRPTENLKAFEYYMQSRAFAYRRTREDLLKAVEFGEKAIAEDGAYALAYAGLADAYASLGIRAYIPPIEGRRQAETAARKALSLDDRLAEAHVALAEVYVLFAPYDFPLVERELQRAMALNPSLAAAHNYRALAHNRQSQFGAAAAEAAKARELDPLSPIFARAASLSFLLKRDYARALEILHRADDLGPQFIIPIEIGVYIQNGAFDEALAGLERAKRDRPDDPMLLFQTGLVYAAQGKRQQALDVIRELEARSDETLNQAHWIAKIYAALHEKELAFSWLDRGLAVRSIGDFYRDEPVWDPIRADPRFANLERRMGNAP
jgi:TolB-like protein/Flp pilus assembly protein TadD